MNRNKLRIKTNAVILTWYPFWISFQEDRVNTLAQRTK